MESKKTLVVIVGIIAIVALVILFSTKSVGAVTVKLSNGYTKEYLANPNVLDYSDGAMVNKPKSMGDVSIKKLGVCVITYPGGFQRISYTEQKYCEWECSENKIYGPCYYTEGQPKPGAGTMKSKMYYERPGPSEYHRSLLYWNAMMAR